MNNDFKNINLCLRENGFTDNEITFYLSLLKLGKANAAEVAKAAKLDKSSAYRASRVLLERGLIIETGGKYDSKLFIDDVQKLKSLFEIKAEKAKSDLEVVDEFIKVLPHFLKSDYIQSKVKVYYGAEGVVRSYEERINAETKLIREVSTSDVQANLLNSPITDADYWHELITTRKNKGIFSHMLVDKKDIDTVFHRTNKEQFKEVRLVPDDFQITAGLNVFGNRIAIHNTRSTDIITLVIDDRAIATLMEQFFDFVWRRSKQI